MGSPSTLGVSTPGVSTSAPPAAGPPTDDASDFSKTFAAELQRRLDEEGWQAGNPAPGRPAAESPPPQGEKAEHPLLRAGPDDLGIRFVNRDDGSRDGNAPTGQHSAFLSRMPTGGTPPPAASRPPIPPGGVQRPGTAMRPVTPSSELPTAKPNLLRGLVSSAARFLGSAALRATGAAGILLDSTGPAGKERETGTTAEGDRVIVDERTIDVRRTDGTRQRGFLNPDGKSWNTADGTLIARRNATGAIEVAPPPTKPTSPAGGNASGAERQQPTGTGERRRSNLEGIEVRSREEQDFVNSLSPHLTREQVQNALEGFRQRNGTVGGTGGSKPPTDVAAPVTPETGKPLGPGELLSKYAAGGYGVIAELDQDGMLNLAIEADKKNDPPTTPKGGKMFDEAMRTFGANVKGIRGTWLGTGTMTDNFKSFKAALKAGLSPEDAASNHTFTGHMSAKWGFTQATVVLNNDEKVVVEFRR